MKTLTSLSVIALIAFTFMHCDDRFGALPTVNNTPPVITFNENLTTLSDSIKISLKHPSGPAAFTLRFSDQEGQIESIGYTFSSGTGRIINSEGADLNGVISPANQEQQLRFEGVDPGQAVVNFRIRDGFAVTSTATLNMFVFINLLPVAGFTAERIQINSPLEYEFNASTSFDPDRSQGGGVAQYEYTINNGFSFRTAERQVRWVFDRTGDHEVRLVVSDNDGTRSQPAIRLINVQ